MRRLIIIPVLLLFGFAGSGQVPPDAVTGKVYEKQQDGKKLPLAGVNVFWLGTTKGTFTDGDGHFTISRQGVRDYRLILSLLGYARDTVEVGTGKGRVDVEMRPAET